MTPHQIKKRLKLLSQQGIADILVDAISIYHEEVCGEEPLDIEAYVEIVMAILKAQKVWCKEQLKVTDVVSKQRDLENLIKAIKDGKE